MTGVRATEPAIKVLVVDDQQLVRRGICLVLDTLEGVEVVGEAADGREGLAMINAVQPDVVLTDARMPVLDGVGLVAGAASRFPGLPVVVLTTFDDDELVFEAVRAGARAYLLKDAAEAEVLETVRAVHRGESRLSPTVARKVLEQFRALAQDWHGAAPAAAPAPAAHAPDALDEPLSDKEERILALLADGCSNKQIAEQVFLAEGTVKNYVSRIMEKLHARNRVELALRAGPRR